jgi:hypothetical protein
MLTWWLTGCTSMQRRVWKLRRFAWYAASLSPAKVADTNPCTGSVRQLAQALAREMSPKGVHVAVRPDHRSQSRQRAHIFLSSTLSPTAALQTPTQTRPRLESTLPPKRSARRISGWRTSIPHCGRTSWISGPHRKSSRSEEGRRNLPDMFAPSSGGGSSKRVASSYSRSSGRGAR